MGRRDGQSLYNDTDWRTRVFSEKREHFSVGVVKRGRPLHVVFSNRATQLELMQPIFYARPLVGVLSRRA
jgi:hypothetical protein